MNKIILFSNIKGGVGKTTTSAHFTEYLTEKGLSAIAVDADLQASLSRHRERELEADPEQQTPWEIVKLNTLDANKLKSDLKKLRQKDSIIVIDCPGNLNDNNLSILYSMADLIVIPMSYDVDTRDNLHSWETRNGHPKNQAERGHQKIFHPLSSRQIPVCCRRACLRQNY